MAGSDRTSFIGGLPKAELHLHIEGTFEPELKLEIATRNGISLPYSSAAQARAAYSFHDLTSFLVGYYESMSVLRVEQDFYDLAMAYFRTASAQHVVYAEVFFDPQAHTSRGVSFETVIGGLHRATLDAHAQLGLRAQLIMCFLRDMSADSALETLEQSLPHRDKIVGVGWTRRAGQPPGEVRPGLRACPRRGLPPHHALRRRQGRCGRPHLAGPGRYRGRADRPRRQLPGG